MKHKTGTHGRLSGSLSFLTDDGQTIKVRVTAFTNTGQLGIYIKHAPKHATAGQNNGTAIQLDDIGAVLAITHGRTRTEAYARLVAALDVTPAQLQTQPPSDQT
jgi:hypothetical protein